MRRVRAPWLLIAAAVVLAACAPEDADTIEKAEVAEKMEQAAEKKMESTTRRWRLRACIHGRKTSVMPMRNSRR